MLHILMQTTMPVTPGMKGWGPSEWTLFLGSLSVFITGATGAIVLVIKAIADLKSKVAGLQSSSQTNAQALVPLMEVNKAAPGPNVDPNVEAAVRSTATGTGDGKS